MTINIEWKYQFGRWRHYQSMQRVKDVLINQYRENFPGNPCIP